MIDPATVDRIKSTAQILDVVGDYVHLIRRGSGYMGLCPFHNERTPSFSVSPQRNYCYCFSCKKGGSPVNFIMEKEGLTYYEALLHLAKKYGIEVQERELTPEEQERRSAREAMLVANEWAMRKMEEDLLQTDEGRDVGLSYITQRGVTDEARKAFHIGYALDKGTHMTESARKAGFNIDVFKALGLTGTSQQGREYDRFRGRVIFPILNTAGKVIAFGGRDLKGGLAKYVNSPESDLYKKSNELYGIFQAKGTIVSEDKCYLVEGYMDVIGMWQSGMKNVVASSGTALTDGQIAMIHRFTNNITLIYDGDAAGIKASLRGIDMLLAHKMNVKVMLLPDGHDPDSFAKANTPEQFRKYVAEHETDIIRYKAQVLLKDVANDPQKRITAVNSVVESVAHIEDPIARDVYVQECSAILGVADSTIAKAVAKARTALLERLRKERNYKLAANTPHSPSNPIVPDVQPETNQAQTPDVNYVDPSSLNPAKKKTESRPAENPLYPLEYAVMRYCVRYGFMNVCTYTGDDGNEYFLNVCEFVSDELEVDGVEFTTEAFSRIFSTLKELKAKFDQDFENECQAIETEIESKRAKGIDEIAKKDLSVAEIKREEKELEERLEEYRNHRQTDFARDYSSRMLCSHEDDQVRSVSIQLACEKHQLSQIYQKDGTYEPESERLMTLVPRAITEWKNEILNCKIKALMDKFKEVSMTGDSEGVQKIQMELTKLMHLRTQVAKDIGDRIIFTGRRK